LTSPRERLAALGMAALLVTAAACGSSSSKTATNGQATTPTSSTETTAAGKTIASTLVLGGPPECQKNAFCIPGLQRVYRITFGSFQSLDADGPLTYAALTSGAVQVGEVFSTDGLIADKGLVVLQDDKHLQSADNIVPVIRNAKNTPAVATLLNKVSALITTDGLTALNKQVTVDKADPSTVAGTFLKTNGLDTKSASASGVSLTVGSFNFGESVLLAFIYGKALQAAGATVTFKTNLGTRQTVEPGLQSGQIDLLPEYAASALEFLDHSAGLASGDTTNNVTKLAQQFQPLSITVLQPAPAIDTNAFAVTKATATKYSLTKMSDLANPAP
jgi:osmoprotectant transport system substrate-binding protein